MHVEEHTYTYASCPYCGRDHTPPRGNTTLQPIGMFHTYETVEELQAYIEQLSGDEAALASMVFALTWNTCAHLTRPA